MARSKDKQRGGEREVAAKPVTIRRRLTRLTTPVVWWLTRRYWLVVLVSFLSVLVMATAMSAFRGVPVPVIEDEFCYLLSGDTFAHGRLTNPAHAHWEHFETFYILNQPTYASKYPPGQGLFLAVGMALFDHPIFGVWLGIATMCAACSWMYRAWLSPRWALAATAITIGGVGLFSYWATSYWGGAVNVIGGALVLGGGRRMVTRATIGAGAAVGAGLAWLAMTRPLEGLVVSLPMGILIARWIWISWRKRRPFLRPVISLIVVVGCGLGFLGYYNKQVTGSATLMPYMLHMQRYEFCPMTYFSSLKPEPEYVHPSLREGYTNTVRLHYPNPFTFSNVAWMQFGKLSRFLDFYGKNFFFNSYIAWLFILVPVFVRWRGWTLFALACLGLLAILHLLTLYYQAHYTAPALPLMVFLIVQALRRVGKMRVGKFAFGKWVLPAYLLLMVAHVVQLAAWEASESSPENLDKRIQAGQIAPLAMKQMINDAMVREHAGTHLILVEYKPATEGRARYNYACDWVYNSAEIDRQPVVWAMHLSPEKDAGLINYYPGRQVWTFNPSTFEILPVKR